MTKTDTSPNANRSESGSDAGRDDPNTRCPNCGNTRPTRFCSACGQNDRSYTRSIRPVVGELIRETFEVDSRLLRTLRLFLFRPGGLSVEFSRNRRARYLSPIRLYLFTSIVSFLALALAQLDPFGVQEPSALDSTATGDAQIVIGGDATGLVDSVARVTSELEEVDYEALRAVMGVEQQGRVDEILVRSPTALSRLAVAGLATILAANRETGQSGEGGTDGDARGDSTEASTSPGLLMRMGVNAVINVAYDPDGFGNRVQDNYGIAMFFLMPIYAAVLAIFFVRQRKFYVEHLVFALHLHSFVFFLWTILMLVVLFPVGNLVRTLSWIAVLATAFLYQVMALRRFYAHRWFGAFVKCGAITFVYFLVNMFAILVVMALSVGKVT